MYVSFYCVPRNGISGSKVIRRYTVGRTKLGWTDLDWSPTSSSLVGLRPCPEARHRVLPHRQGQLAEQALQSHCDFLPAQGTHSGSHFLLQLLLHFAPSNYIKEVSTPTVSHALELVPTRPLSSPLQGCNGPHCQASRSVLRPHLFWMLGCMWSGHPSAS